MLLDLLGDFLLAIFATGGFSLIFKVPLKRIPVCMAVGGLGWVCYELVVQFYSSAVMGCFLASCLVGLLSTFCSKLFKDAATIFVIPGIVCLVPGSKIYETMYAFIDKDLTTFIDAGSATLMMAGAIALGLLFIGAFTSTLRAIVNKTPFGWRL